jgi:hypothetical protein
MTYNIPLEPSIFAQGLHACATDESVRFNKWLFLQVATHQAILILSVVEAPQKIANSFRAPDGSLTLHPHTVNV